MSEPLRQLEVRVGSATDALTPLSRATRSFAATPVQWMSLTAIALAAVVADQVTKHIVAANLALGDRVHVVGPFAIRHVQNSGIAFGFFAHATAAVIVAHRGRDRLDARLLRPLRRAPSGAAHRARARDRRQHLEPRRPGAARLRHRFPRLPLLARVQPRRQLHRDRGRDPRSARSPLAERSPRRCTASKR